MQKSTAVPRQLPAISYRPSQAGFRRDVLNGLVGRKFAVEQFGLALHKAVLLPTFTLTAFACVVSGRLHGAWLAAAEMVFVFSCLLAALGLAHDASHSALSRRGWMNKLGTFVFDFVGVNGRVWHFDHVTAHHSTPNISRYDANLYGWGPIRLDPHAPRRGFHRYQHVYAWFIYLFASIFKVFAGDFLAFWRVRVDAYLPPKHPPSEWAQLAAFKIWSLMFTLFIPLWMNGGSKPVLLGYFLGHLCAGVLMGTVFQPTHTNEYVAWPRPDADGAIDDTFEAHVLATAADFSVESRFVTWLAGGLNIHAVHHLFPKIPQLELIEAARAVRDAAPRYGLRYHTFPTWGAALRSHYRMLRALGTGEPVTAPRVADPAAVVDWPAASTSGHR